MHFQLQLFQVILKSMKMHKSAEVVGNIEFIQNSLIIATGEVILKVVFYIF